MEKNNKNTLNIYESALLSIGKRLIIPDNYYDLLNANFSRISINNCRYIVTSVVDQDNKNLKKLHFNSHDTENFSGFECVSEKLNIFDVLKERFEHGRITITYHRDMDAWTSFIVLYPSIHDDKNASTISNIIDFKIFKDI